MCTWHLRLVWGQDGRLPWRWNSGKFGVSSETENRPPRHREGVRTDGIQTAASCLQGLVGQPVRVVVRLLCRSSGFRGLSSGGAELQSRAWPLRAARAEFTPGGVRTRPGGRSTTASGTGCEGERGGRGPGHPPVFQARGAGPPCQGEGRGAGGCEGRPRGAAAGAGGQGAGAAGPRREPRAAAPQGRVEAGRGLEGQGRRRGQVSGRAWRPRSPLVVFLRLVLSFFLLLLIVSLLCVCRHMQLLW